MAARWSSARLRAGWVSGHACLILLGMLTESYASEREVLGEFYARFGYVPGAKEFRSMVRALSAEGFIEVETVARGRLLRIRDAGVRLLERLRAENRRLVAVLEG